MPRPSKIVNENEARRMLAYGETPQRMVEFYRSKYGIETTTSLWSRAFARFFGGNREDILEEVKARPIELPDIDDNPHIPWIIQEDPEGRDLYEALRTLDDYYMGGTGDPEDHRARAEGEAHERLFALERIRQDLAFNNEVIAYDHEANRFYTAPRRPGIDKGFIREPWWDDAGRRMPIRDLEDRITPTALAKHYPLDVTITLPPTRDASLWDEWLEAWGVTEESTPMTPEDADKNRAFVRKHAAPLGGSFLQERD